MHMYMCMHMCMCMYPQAYGMNNIDKAFAVAYCLCVAVGYHGKFAGWCGSWSVGYQGAQTRMGCAGELRLSSARQLQKLV